MPEHSENQPELTEAPISGRVSLYWGAWLLGIIALALVIMVAAHFSEEQAIFNSLRQAQPEWLLAAVFTQCLTYLVQAGIWRSIISNGGNALPLLASYQLSLAKLLVNQAVPTVGIGGTLFVARGLQRIGATRPQSIVGVLIDMVGFYLATAISLAIALALAILFSD